MSWNSGYTSDIDYTLGYYAQTNPINAEFAVALAGLKPPKIRTACELGFGNGISLNFHALNKNIEWYGNDFNPRQAQFASELNRTADLNSFINDEDFQTFCNRNDLPSFDFIALHGIWSWVSEPNRETILQFLREKLNIGGVVYISYNTMPGWSSMIPLRQLMSEFVRNADLESNNTSSIIDKAISSTEKFLSQDPLFLKANPGIMARFKELKQQKKQYIAHEYFNRDWEPMSFARMSDYMTDAKLSYCAPADFLDFVPSANFSEEHINYMNSFDNLTQREMVKDFLTNCQFRQEYWIKGGRKMSNAEREQEILTSQICLVSDAPFSFSVERHARKATLAKDIYGPIMQQLQRRKPTPIKTLLENINLNHQLNFGTLVEAICVLHGLGEITVVEPDHEASNLKDNAMQMNRHLINALCAGYENSHLVSPMTKSGILLDTVQQIFVEGFLLGLSTKEELASFAWGILKIRGRRLMRNSEILVEEKDNIEELEQRADKFLSTKIEHLRAYEII